MYFCLPLTRFLQQPKSMHVKLNYVSNLSSCVTVCLHVCLICLCVDFDWLRVYLGYPLMAAWLQATTPIIICRVWGKYQKCNWMELFRIHLYWWGIDYFVCKKMLVLELKFCQIQAPKKIHNTLRVFLSFFEIWNSDFIPHNTPNSSLLYISYCL